MAHLFVLSIKEFTMETEAQFKVGQRVITPKGEGVVILIVDRTVKVKLNSGEIRIYDVEKLSDDSAAG